MRLVFFLPTFIFLLSHSAGLSFEVEGPFWECLRGRDEPWHDTFLGGGGGVTSLSKSIPHVWSFLSRNTDQ